MWRELSVSWALDVVLLRFIGCLQLFYSCQLEYTLKLQTLNSTNPKLYKPYTLNLNRVRGWSVSQLVGSLRAPQAPSTCHPQRLLRRWAPLKESLKELLKEPLKELLKEPLKELLKELLKEPLRVPLGGAPGLRLQGLRI